MKHSLEFELAWQGLKNGEHIFDYRLGNDFFKNFPAFETEVKDIEADVKLKFVKHESFFELHFDVGGKIITPCDRCGDDFEMQLWDEFDLIVKLGDGDDNTPEEAEEADVVFIPRSETVIDLSKWLYEFVVLSIPIQRIHPLQADGTPACNPEAIKLLDKLAEQPSDKKNDIWDGLKSIRINKNNNKHKN